MIVQKTPQPDTSTSKFVYANWSLRRTSKWHRATCTGTDIDKQTLCGAVMTQHAQWAHRSRPTGCAGQEPRFCEKCEEQAMREMIL